MHAQIRRWYNKLGLLVYSRHANIALIILFYLDAILFFPVEPILVLYCIERRDKAMLYALLATGASLMGGITSYCIGVVLWKTMGMHILHAPIIHHVITPASFSHFCSLFKTHQSWALLMAGFSPIPFKAATLTAGFCRLSCMPFIMSVCLVRGIRFFACAYIAAWCSPRAKEYIERYFNRLALAVLLCIVCIIWCLK